MKKALIAIGLAAATYGTVSWIKSDAPTTKPGHVSTLDRIWIDHLPQNDRDIVNVFAAITEEPFGIFQSTSMWTGSFEMFRYKDNGKELAVHYPQTGKDEKIATKARECDVNGFDYCLEITGTNHGVTKYYSLEGWELGTHDPAAIKARVEQVLAQRNSK